jgi:hypothetical protein
MAGVGGGVGRTVACFAEDTFFVTTFFAFDRDEVDWRLERFFVSAAVEGGGSGRAKVK